MKLLLSGSRWLAVAAIILSLTGCFKDSITRTYTIMRPVYKTKAEVVAAIKGAVPQSLKSPGKILAKGNYLFINERDKGIHVFDNSAPSSPKALSFIAIPGNLDMGVKGNTLYADMYDDLVAIDISDLQHIKPIAIANKVFPDRDFGSGIDWNAELIIVDWITKDTTVDVNSGNGNWYCPGCRVMPNTYNNSGKGGGVQGVAGSMARFIIVNDFLYALQTSELGIFNIADPLHLMNKGKSVIGNGIETIYSFENRLFIGSNSGTFIYNIDKPSEPEMEGTFTHARVCDPVMADDDHAFVTLRTGNACWGTVNRLDILDISNVLAPTLIKSYPMTNPHGLAKEDDLLFICDGRDGLKIFDASDINIIKPVKQFQGMEAYDVIALDKKLILIATEGLFQYDYSDKENIHLVSTITVNR